MIYFLLRNSEESGKDIIIQRHQNDRFEPLSMPTGSAGSTRTARLSSFPLFRGRKPNRDDRRSASPAPPIVFFLNLRRSHDRRRRRRQGDLDLSPRAADLNQFSRVESRLLISLACACSSDLGTLARGFDRFPPFSLAGTVFHSLRTDVRTWCDRLVVIMALVDVAKCCLDSLSGILEHIKDATLYIDGGCTESFQYLGAFPLPLSVGARSVCSLENMSPLDMVLKLLMQDLVIKELGNKMVNSKFTGVWASNLVYFSVASAEGQDKRRTDNSLPTIPPLPHYKSELKSGPVRNPGTVPFVWEQCPGRPKNESLSRSQTPDCPPAAPETSTWEDCESTTSDEGAKKKETTEEKGFAGSGDEAYLGALDKFSRSESFFLNCSVSGLSGVDGSDMRLSGRFSRDPPTRDFMMGRFLPSAKAMASEAPLHFIRKQSVAQDLPRHPVKKAAVGGENHRLEVLKPNVLPINQVGVGEESEDDDYYESCKISRSYKSLRWEGAIHSEDYVFEIQATSKKVEEAILVDCPLNIENIEHPEKKTLSELEDSWLSRALATASSKKPSSRSSPGVDVVNGNHASESAPVDPKWETIVKSSNVNHRHLRFSETSSISRKGKRLRLCLIIAGALLYLLC
ncbi:hypothetical protein NL676_001011 [Syzygium grande]|nr:hypothetical protein NL676_001011 [Syzygium grande]